MNLTDEELDYERFRRNFIKYTQVCGKGKEVSFDIYNNFYKPYSLLIIYK